MRLFPEDVEAAALELELELAPPAFMNTIGAGAGVVSCDAAFASSSTLPMSDLQYILHYIVHVMRGRVNCKIQSRKRGYRWKPEKSL